MQSNNAKKTYRVGIIGIGFGRQVLLPAFRSDSRCTVTAVAASNQTRAEKVASEEQIPEAFGDWKSLIPCVDIVAIAVPPMVQAQILQTASQSGKAIFAEKPLTGSFSSACALAETLRKRQTSLAVDFMFPQIETWQRTKQLLKDETIGVLRHIELEWTLETYAERTRIHNWKSQLEQGGGALHTFGSHVFHNLEFFGGKIETVSAQLDADANSAEHAFELRITFQSGATANVFVSTRMPYGKGHRWEFTGTQGTLVLHNGPKDYVSGFTLAQVKDGTVDVLQVEKNKNADGRLFPVLKNISTFIDHLEGRDAVFPNLDDGLRAEELMAKARLSNEHESDRYSDPSLQRRRKHTVSA